MMRCPVPFLLASLVFISPPYSLAFHGGRLPPHQSSGGSTRRSPRPISASASSDDLSFSSTYIDDAGKPRGFCNWIVPGKVLIGRYPHCYSSPDEESPCPSREEAEEHIRALTDAGVNTYVTLLEEAEAPAQDNDDAWMSSQSKFERYYEDAVSIADELDVPTAPSFEHVPVSPDADLTADPDKMEDLIGALYDLRDRVKCENAVVYMHCRGGRGRAGTIGACMYLLLRLNDVASLPFQEAAERAIEMAQRGYDSRTLQEDGDGGEQSIVSEEQRLFVENFANVLYGHQAW